MTPRQAAALIGCSVSQVRVLCQKGILANRCRSIPGGYYYDIDRGSAKAYRDTPQRQGFPRGQKRA